MRRVPLLIGALAPFVAVSIFHLSVKAAGLVELDRATKGLTVPALILGVLILLISKRVTLSLPVALTLIGGLTLSWLGDITLGTFVVGLGFFFAAHVVYIVMFALAFRRRPSWWTLGLIPWFLGLVLSLNESVGGLIWLVSAYGIVLGVMAVMSTRGNTFTMLGGALFVASDSILAFRLFTPLFASVAEDVFIMAAYLGAQLCITLGILRIGMVTAPERPAPPA